MPKHRYDRQSPRTGRGPMNPKRVAKAVLMALCLLLMGCQTGSRAESNGGDDAPRAKGQYLVEVERRAGAHEVIQQAFQQWQVEQIGALETDRPLFVVFIGQDPGPEAVQSAVEGERGIVHVQPNYKYSTSGGTGDAEKRNNGTSPSKD